MGPACQPIHQHKCFDQS